jgi:GT2 family glycosyltransferase
MISIITAVHNGLPASRIFYASLAKYTHYPFELIIIDNASAPDTGSFFRDAGAVVITNGQNYSYPYSQNQGIEAARHEYLCFMNNDVVVSPDWDKRLLDSLLYHRLDLISACGVEHMESPAQTRRFSRKWKTVKNLLSVFGRGSASLKAMHSLMYGNWESFCNRLYQEHHLEVIEGIVGNNVLMTRRALQLLGRWDERIQGADFDLFMRAKKRANEVGDIRPCHIALDVFIHHYIRLTQKSMGKLVSYADGDRMISLEEKWTSADRELLHPDRASHEGAGILK